MENNGSKHWTETYGKATVVYLPAREMPPERTEPASLKKWSSETKLSTSSFDGFIVKRVKNKVVIVSTTSSSSSSASTLVTENFMRQEMRLLNEFEQELGSEISGITTGPLGLSRSWSNIVRCTDEEDLPVARASSSCCNMSKPYQKLEVLPKIEAMREYNRANRMYKVYVNASAEVLEYPQAKYDIELSYPNYWKHLCEKLYLEVDSKTEIEETECQLDFIETCRQLLSEENDLRNENRPFPVLKGEDVFEDFEACAMFMKDNFPYLFTYLMQKYDFDNFSVKKLLVNKNRNEIVRLMELPHEELVKREEKYTTSSS